MLSAVRAFDPTVSKNRHLVRSGPLVSMRRLQFIANTKGMMRQTIDILVDDTLSLINTNGKISVSPFDNFEHGIRTTLVEQILGGGTPDNDWKQFEAIAVLSDTASIKSWSDQAGAPIVIRDRLTADLEPDGVLVMLGRQGIPLWWRINPHTGQALGMGPFGGQEVTERVTFYQVASAMIGISSLVYGTRSCLKTYPDNSTMANCCVAGNAIVSAGFGGYSGVISKEMVVEAAVSPMLAAIGWITAALGVEIMYEGLSTAMGGVMIDKACRSLLAD
jgi:hypothetical protein